MVLHGGFWKAEYDLTLMDALCEDLAQRGWAAWNVEYRRLGNGGGVPETLEDVVRRDRLPGGAGRRPLAGRDDRPLRGRPSRGVGGDPRQSPRGRHRRRLPGGRARPRARRRAEPLQRGRQPLPRRAVHERRLADRSACRSAFPRCSPTAASTTPCRSRSPRRSLAPRARRWSSSPTRTTTAISIRTTRSGRRWSSGCDPRRRATAGRRRPARVVPRPVRDLRRASDLPRRQLARPAAEGHARAAAPRRRPVGHRAGRRLARLDRGAAAAPATRWPR